MPSAALERAPAKLNLALHVRGRRADGYHELETLFAFTDFGDTLSAEPAPDWSLELTGPTAADAGPLDDNLVLRAARAFAAATGSRAQYAFRLHKRIPVAAGLGGGSADAGAALRLLNRLAGGPLSPAALEALGATLGADVPACVRSRTAVGRGVGEQLAPGPELAGTPVLLANPGVAVPTGPVFARSDGIDRGPLGPDWRHARNDLEGPAIALQPVIAELLDWLSGLPGVTLARMSGSGATCFALFDRAVPEVSPPAGWWVQPARLL
ncbi:MAG: 4-(cytidine 5'-diphospho)-2-C-methyl-D-erythritol kinase [Sphingomonadaceae bacterium]